ncbi:hypothetical protein SNEBB_000394 [Seison nebaliae]|nr:hypothetical protein SNEBB_000394 [Seison nebaliae]
MNSPFSSHRFKILFPFLLFLIILLSQSVYSNAAISDNDNVPRNELKDLNPIINTTDDDKLPDSEFQQRIFLHKAIAKIISGIFAALALVINGKHIFSHLSSYTNPNEQKWIVRLLFIVPTYTIYSFVSLLFFNHETVHVYFSVLRDAYEAFVIYSFLSLCYAYLGGAGNIVRQLRYTKLDKLTVKNLTLHFIKANPPELTEHISYSSQNSQNDIHDQQSVRFLRFCKQTTFQFCVVKLLMVPIIIALQATYRYHEGDLSVHNGYLYTTIIYNISITIALYGFIMFYTGTKVLLSPFQPVFKFVCVKAIIFLTFWQGFLLAVLEKVKIIQALQGNGEIRLSAGAIAAGWQNFFICFEMFFAAMCLQLAFPVRCYSEGQMPFPEFNRRGKSKGTKRSVISANLGETMNYPKDLLTDAIHNFHPNYQHYVAY